MLSLEGLALGDALGDFYLYPTLDGEGDMDTTCAIVGGLVALAVGRSGLPEDWQSALEPLNTSPGKKENRENNEEHDQENTV